MLNRIYFFNRRSASFHTLLALNLFHFTFHSFRCHQPLPLFFSRCLLSACHLLFISLLSFFIFLYLSLSLFPSCFYATMSIRRYPGEINDDSFIMIQYPSMWWIPRTLPDGRYNMLRFLRWVRETSNNHAKKPVAVMQFKNPRHKQPAVAPGFTCAGNEVPRKFGT